MTIKKGIRYRVSNIFSSASGTGAIAGAHNVCHMICVGLASFLSIFGIIISDTALMFLEDFALPFWIMGLFFFMLSLIFYLYRRHGSQKLLLANAGILIAGVPLTFLSNYLWFLWAVGGTMVTASIVWYIQDKYEVFEWTTKK